MTPEEALISLQSQITSKRIWLDTFSSGSKKRPDHEIEIKRKEALALEMVAQWFANGLAKRNSAA